MTTFTPVPSFQVSPGGTHGSCRMRARVGLRGMNVPPARVHSPRMRQRCASCGTRRRVEPPHT
eukprot:5340635-Prymnesium_polylepis.1